MTYPPSSTATINPTSTTMMISPPINIDAPSVTFTPPGGRCNLSCTPQRTLLRVVNTASVDNTTDGSLAGWSAIVTPILGIRETRHPWKTACPTPLLPPQYHIVSCMSIAVHFGFQNLLNRCRNVRQKIISCGCLDDVNTCQVGLPLRIDAVDIRRIDGNDVGACCNAVQIFGSISQHNRYLPNMGRHGNVSTINRRLITA